MTTEEHEKERRAFWDACCAAPYSNPCDGEWDNPQSKDEASMCAGVADAKLAERDKRFPAPEGEELCTTTLAHQVHGYSCFCSLVCSVMAQLEAAKPDADTSEDTSILNV